MRNAIHAPSPSRLSSLPRLARPREEARVFDLDSARFLERNPRRCRGGERKKKDSRAIDFVTRWPRSLVTRNFIQILCRLHRYRLLFQLRRGRL